MKTLYASLYWSLGAFILESISQQRQNRGLELADLRQQGNVPNNENQLMFDDKITNLGLCLIDAHF